MKKRGILLISIIIFSVILFSTISLSEPSGDYNEGTQESEEEFKLDDSSTWSGDKVVNNWGKFENNPSAKSKLESDQISKVASEGKDLGNLGDYDEGAMKDALSNSYDVKSIEGSLNGANINGDTLNIGSSKINLKSGNQLNIERGSNGKIKQFNDGQGNKCSGCSGITYTSGGELSGTNDDNTEDEGDGGFLGGLDKVSQADSLNTGLFRSDAITDFENTGDGFTIGGADNFSTQGSVFTDAEGINFSDGLLQVEKSLRALIEKGDENGSYEFVKTKDSEYNITVNNTLNTAETTINDSSKLKLSGFNTTVESVNGSTDVSIKKESEDEVIIRSQPSILNKSLDNVSQSNVSFDARVKIVVNSTSSREVYWSKGSTELRKDQYGIYFIRMGSPSKYEHYNKEYERSSYYLRNPTNQTTHNLFLPTNEHVTTNKGFDSKIDFLDSDGLLSGVIVYGRYKDGSPQDYIVSEHVNNSFSFSFGGDNVLINELNVEGVTDCLDSSDLGSVYNLDYKISMECSNGLVHRFVSQVTGGENIQVSQVRLGLIERIGFDFSFKEYSSISFSDGQLVMGGSRVKSQFKGGSVKEGVDEIANYKKDICINANDDMLTWVIDNYGS